MHRFKCPNTHASFQMPSAQAGVGMGLLFNYALAKNTPKWKYGIYIFCILQVLYVYTPTSTHSTVLSSTQL